MGRGRLSACRQTCHVYLEDIRSSGPMVRKSWKYMLTGYCWLLARDPVLLAFAFNQCLTSLVSRLSKQLFESLTGKARNADLIEEVVYIGTIDDRSAL